MLLFVFLSGSISGYSANSAHDGSSGVEPMAGMQQSAPADSIGVLIHADTLLVSQEMQFSLPEVTVSAFNRSRRLLDTPGSVSMIGSGALERESPVNVLPLLNFSSGVFAHEGTMTTNRITIRGIGARVPYATGKLRAYMNGIPLTNGSGISIIEHIDPLAIERIEIIKGPASSVYGAGLGGTLNIMARQPLLRSPRVSAMMDAGSCGLVRSGLTLDMGNERLGGSLVYSFGSSDGYRHNNSYQRNTLTSLLQWRPEHSTSLTALFTYTDMHTGIPSSIDSVLFVQNPRAAAANWARTNGYQDVRIMLAGISGTHSFHSGISADMALFTTLHEEKEMRPFDVLYENRFSGGGRFKMNYLAPFNTGTLHLIGGTELFLERFDYNTNENIGGEGVQGAMISDHLEQIHYFNLFAQGDLEFSRINLSAGLNLHHTATVYRDLFFADNPDSSATYKPGYILSPRISANYRYAEYQAVFFSVSHGFSPAALSETLTPEGLVNMDIRPELSWNVEFGGRGNLFNHRVFYDVNLYQMMVRDLLVAERVGADAWVGRNAGASLHRGFEAEAEAYFIRKGIGEAAAGSWWRISEMNMASAFTFNHFVFTDFSDYGVDYSGNFIPGVPKTNLSSVMRVSLQGGLFMHLGMRAVGRMPMNDLNDRYTEAYQLLSLTAGYRTRLGRWALDVHARVNNLFDTHHASMILVNAPSFGGAPPRYYYPGLPRHYVTSLRLSRLL